MKMRCIYYGFSILGFFLIFLACNQKIKESASHSLLEKLGSESTNIDFSNTLTENDSLNYFTYAYIYMGGGVSAGDINNDGLIDLFFTGNMVPNKLYLNEGNMTFKDISNSAGIAGDDRWYTGTTMADVNNDGFIDIYCSVGGKFGDKANQLYINNRDNTFTERSKEYGLDDKSNSVQGTFFDYDKDGDLDLYVANYPPTPFDAPNYYYAIKQMSPKEFESDRLFRNDGNSFVDVTEIAGIKNFGLSLSATIADLNKDGWPDIYVSCDFSTPDFLYINKGDGTFTEELKNATKNTAFYGMGVDIADYNNDSWLDILQVDMTPQINRRSKANMASMNPALFWSTVKAGFHYQYMQNALQLNNGILNDSVPDFSNLSRLAGVSSTDWSWGPLFADLDNDGWKDIFISNGTRREINNRDFFLAIGKKGVPKEESLEMSLAIPSEKIPNYAFKNNGDLTFKMSNEDWGIKEKGFSNGCVYVDLDNDGDLEIVTNNIDEKATIYKNHASENSNSVSINFNGPDKNRFGIGVAVSLYSSGKTQYQEMTLTRGFQSSVAPRLHFGLSNQSEIDSLVIVWPDGKREKKLQVDLNSLSTINYTDAKSVRRTAIVDKNLLFNSKISSENLVTHKHIENYYDDFLTEVLLPHQTSMFGPNVAVGDLNNDGLDDFIVGGAKGYATTAYVQQDAGFVELQIPDFIADMEHEDLGILIFDADADSDNDIYVVSGGNEFSKDSPLLQDRIYINKGNGTFIKDQKALPFMITSGSRVKSHDYDDDGDLDLFVGGRLVPGSYPTPASSYILENQSKNGEVRFSDITSKLLPELTGLGMVTDAKWTDVDNDGRADLIVVGEWMNVRVFRNEGDNFREISEALGLNDTAGWWFSVNAADFDGDGDQDIIAGNLGLNYKYKATEEETFDIYYNDFDENSKGDIVLSYYNQGEKFPVRGRECSSQQIPEIKKKFQNYESFSTATITDIYPEKALQNALHYQVKSFGSAYFENRDGRFIRHPLPQRAQWSSINQILLDDYNNDGHLDALIAGNLHSSEVETPRNDASVGLLLEGDGRGGFEPKAPRESGFVASGDVKDMASLTVAGKQIIIVAKNSDYIQFVEVEKKGYDVEQSNNIK